MFEQPQEEGQPQQAGFAIEIRVAADGQITVSAEPMTEEAGEPAGRPVADFREALQVAEEAFRSGGQIAQAGEGEDDFKAGFATGPKPPEGPARKFA